MIWSLLLLGATVGISVDEVRGVDPAQTAELTDALLLAVEDASGAVAVVDTRIWNACKRADRCLEEVRVRTKARDVVFVQLFGGVRRVRISAERVREDGSRTSSSGTLALRTDPKAPLAKIAAQLFPEGPALPTPAPPVTVTVPPPEPATNWPAWIAGATTVAATGVAVGFGLSARSAASSLDNRVTSRAEYDALSGRADDHGAISNIAIATAAVGAAVAITFVLLDVFEAPAAH